MNTKGESSQKPPIMLLHQVAKSQVTTSPHPIVYLSYLILSNPLPQVCVESLANCDCVSPLHRAMKLRKDLLVVVCETFNRMFAYNHDSLVSQALSCGLVKDLLNILNSRLDNIPNASSCKAQVCPDPPVSSYPSPSCLYPLLPSSCFSCSAAPPAPPAPPTPLPRW